MNTIKTHVFRDFVLLVVYTCAATGDPYLPSQTTRSPYVYDDFGRCELSGTCRSLGIFDGNFDDTGIAFRAEHHCLDRARTYFEWCRNKPHELVLVCERVLACCGR
jgi:hypothetical protein